MDSITFTPGHAFLKSDSAVVPWALVFEDEGTGGYLYACDRSGPAHSSAIDEQSIQDSMLIYNVGSLEDPTRARLAAIQWSRDGLQAIFYLDGTPQAFVDFAARQSFCRSNFPNFMEQQGDTWRKSSHAWDDARVQSFEAALYH